MLKPKVENYSIQRTQPIKQKIQNRIEMSITVEVRVN